MSKAISLLFDYTINGQPLFKNQQDLVTQILQEPDNEYFVSPDDIEAYNRMQNRLKAYISQLLSASVTRNITVGFEDVLRRLISKKVDNADLTDKIVSEIISELKSKKAPTPKVEPKGNLLDQLTSDFKNGQYISIITSRPLEIEADMITDEYSLRKLVFEDFIETLSNPNKKLKDYRFNFPVDSSGSLFWKGINKMLIKHLKGLTDKKSFLKIIEAKIGVSFESNMDLFDDPILSDLELHKTSEMILRALRRDCNLVVFTCEAPIFTLPLIIIDPAETKNAKVYAIINSEGGDFNIYKFSNEEIVLWRLFVWDKIKSQSYCGRIIEFDNK